MGLSQDIETVVRALESRGVEPKDLDDLIYQVAYDAAGDDQETDDASHDDASGVPDGILCHWEGLASETNNQGLEGQVRFLFLHLHKGRDGFAMEQVQAAIDEYLEEA